MSQDQSLNKRALETIRQLRRRVAELESGTQEPIAIIGMGCRLPSDIGSPDELWQALLEQRDLLTAIPASRWDMASLYDVDPDAPGKMNSPRAGLVAGLEAFDADLFEFSPREAARLDPQQRMLLETTWRTLEHAGVSPTTMRGTRTAAFVGIATQDYLQLQTADARTADAHTATGCDAGFAAGRLAFYFDWHGPTLSINTLCSSSLVALHAACASLRNQEADCALVAGVNALFWPTQSIIATKFRALSASGACRTFDAGADGFVRSEGCGAVLLKRLSDARRDGDRVVALVRGSATNHDGRGLGLTAPNGWAQSDVMRRALAISGVDPQDVGLVEAHGTATSLGDPIEVDSIREVYGQGNKACALGALKSNLGHLEAAAGIVGVIKAALCLERGVIPGNINFETLNPRIEIEGTRFYVPTNAKAWEESQRSAVVSAFGLSGTNAHAVLTSAEAAEAEEPPSIDDSHHVYRLSAKTATALGRQAKADAEFLAEATAPLADICYTIERQRPAFEHKVFCVGRRAADIALALDRFGSTGEVGPNLYSGQAAVPPKIGFLFTGQGSQYSGMAGELYHWNAKFRLTLDRCEQAFRLANRESLLDVMWARGCSPDSIDRTQYTQPALYAVGCALVDMLRAWGVDTACVLGHSVGEFAAAYAAGVLELEEGLSLISRRAHLMQSLPAGSGMLAVSASRSQVESAIGAGLLGAEIVAFNGPVAIVLGGPDSCLARCAAELAQVDIASHRLDVSHAFHSRQMDPILAPFRVALSGIRLASPRIQFISSSLGRLVQGDELSKEDYWINQVREPVRFDTALRAAGGAAIDYWVELGPRPILSSLAARALPSLAGAFLPTLGTSNSEQRDLLSTVARLAASGVRVNWSAVEGEKRRNRVTVPPYAFDRRLHWNESAVAAGGFASDNAYSVVWERSPLASFRSLDSGRKYVLIGEPHAMAAAEGQLRESGNDVRVLGLDFTTADLATAFSDGSASECLVVLCAIQAVGESGKPSTDAPSALSVEARWCERALDIARVLRAAGRTGTRLCVVTQNVQAVFSAAEAPTSVYAASLWGLTQCLALELPEYWAGIIDSPAGEPIRAEWLSSLGSDSESEVAWRAGQRYVRRISRLKTQGERHEGSYEGGYLILGGTGGLGVEVARSLIRRGASRTVLMSRRGEHAGNRAQIESLRRTSPNVIVVKGDVTRPDDLRDAIALTERDGVRLRGVIHAAGIAEKQTTLSVCSDQLHDALSSKVAGTEALMVALKGHDPEFVLLFSSIAGVWGAPELAAYAAANAYLDAVARKFRGGVKSIQWGPWLDRGLMTPEQARESARAGVGTLPTEVALIAVERVIAAGPAESLVVSLDAPKFAAAQRSRAPRRLFDQVAPPREAARTSQATPPHAPRKPARAQGGEDLEHVIAAELATVLQLDTSVTLDPERGLFDLGLDSILAVELRGRLESIFGLQLRPTVFVDAPSVRALSQLIGQSESVERGSRANIRHASDASEPIAIVGMGCRFPGAGSPAQFWELLRSGKDATSEAPLDRWPSAAGAEGRLRWRGGFLTDVAGFDPEFFGIAAREARNMDPQQRLLLEVAWEAFESAGWDPARLRDRRVGVYTGVGPCDHALGGVAGFDAAYYGSGNAASGIPGRVAYLLGLRGPALAIDAACASSLVAAHLACEALRGGECDAAVAGGVSLMLSAEGQLALAEAKMMAADGRCKTFDAKADGYGRGEGCGLVVLKRLSDAQKDGDPIIAVLLGSAVNQNGASGGLTVPSGRAQREVIEAALARAGVAGSDVAYVEAHGTGTALGDPVEVQALGEAYGTQRARPLLVGSVKTNIGHLEAAAGIAGLIKTALCIQHATIAKSLHFEQPNPRVDWASHAVAVAALSTDWPSDTGRPVAGVSSFGFTGTNAHMLIAAPPAIDAKEEESGPQILKISARTSAALWSTIRSWQRALDGASSSLVDVAFTANTGRGDHPFRFCTSVSSWAELRLELTAAASFGLVDQATSFYGEQRRRRLVLDLGRPLSERSGARVMQEALGILGTGAPAWPAAGDDGSDGAAAHAASCAVLKVLRTVGLRPAAIFALDAQQRLARYALEELAPTEVQSGGPPSLDPETIVLGFGAPRGGSEVKYFVDIEQGLLCALAKLYVLGFEIDWQSLYAGRHCRVALPTTHFERRPLWNKVSQPLSSTPRFRALGLRLASGSVDALFRLEVNPVHQPFLLDHRVFGDLIVPGTYHVALALSALAESGGSVLEKVTFFSPLRLLAHESRAIEVERVGNALEVRSMSAESAQWVVHATAFVGEPAGARESGPRESLLRESMSQYRSGREFYELIGERDLLLGPAFSWISEVWSRTGEAIVELRAPTAYELSQAQDFAIFPGLLDSALQSLAATIDVDANDVVIPVAVGRIELTGPIGPERLVAQVRLHEGGADAREYVGSMVLARVDGSIALRVDELRVRRVERHVFRRSAGIRTSAMLCDLGWGTVPPPATPSHAKPVELVILSSHGDPLGGELQRALSDLPQASPLRVVRCTVCTSVAGITNEVAPASDERAAAVDILWLVGGRDEDLGQNATATRGTLEGVLSELQYLLQALPSGAARLWALVPDGPTQSRRATAQATVLRGMIRCLLHERRDVFAGLINVAVEDLRAPAFRDGMAQLLTEAVAAEYRLTATGVTVARLQPRPSAGAGALSFAPEEAMVIAGGGAALGASLLPWLCERGARQFVLVGRSSPSEQALGSISQLEAAGASVRWLSTDIGSEQGRQALVDLALALRETPVSVFHLAGVNRDAILERITHEDLRQAFEGKAKGAWNLHQAFSNPNVRRFVQFSSIAAAVGNAGQGAYAASNAYLNWLADERRGQGLTVLTMLWGPWAGPGMFDGKTDSRRLRALAPSAALALLEAALLETPSRDLIAIDVGTPVPTAPFSASELLQSRTASAPAEVEIDVAGLAGLASVDMTAIVAEWLLKVVERVVGAPLAATLALTDAGLDSLMAVEIREVISRQLGVRVDIAELLRGPTVEELADRVGIELRSTAGRSEVSWHEGEL